ncbi:DUF6259 domain-containing protein [bacterium]|nr:DUF6259 domain-containing protein [bacterium]
MPWRILCVIAILTVACGRSAPPAEKTPPASAAGDIYDGRVFGIYKPLEAVEKDGRITVSGETFAWTFDCASGQVISARALGDEFLAAGASFPNPYVGLFPASDPGASVDGTAESRPRYGFEKAVAIRPTLFSGGLTSAVRLESIASDSVTTRLVSSAPENVEITSNGRYLDEAGQPTGLRWEVGYRIDVDGFMKVTVRLSTERKLMLRWHCYNHTMFDRRSVRFMARDEDPGAPPFNIRQAPTVSLEGLAEGAPVLESHFNTLFHLGNPLTGIEFTKEEFSERLSGYRDSAVRLPDGKVADTGSVETTDGKVLEGWDSRGRQDIFTQIYNRPAGLELEEFDVRNTTVPLNPGETRERSFYVQLTPPKLPRAELAGARIVWPGPHQIRMAGWKGDSAAWEPPSDEQVRQWAQIGVNLIVGGANYFSGDYARPDQPEKIRHFLETAHGLGLRVIPYVTTSDWDFSAPGYQEHAADWMSSKDIEFITETSLMCFGAEGWRKHVEGQCDTLLMNFPFDGLYVDNWFITRHCTNARHGCGGYLGRYVTDGYHDFARRLRRVVARHTGGKGIMLFNTDNVSCSTSLAWFDLRLSGENNNPLRLAGETVLSTWNGKRQGVQSVAMWREGQDPLDMLNFCARYGFSFRLIGGRRESDMLERWSAAASPDTPLGFNRLYWDIERFFGVGAAQCFSAFDSRDVLNVSGEGSTVTAYARDGRVLLCLGCLPGGAAVASRAPRGETLSLRQPETLGLDPAARYRLVDLVAAAYLEKGRTFSLTDLAALKLALTPGRTSFLLLEPASEGPRLVFFRGADGAAVEAAGDTLKVTLEAPEGAPLGLYLDPDGGTYQSLTPEVQPTAGASLAAFSGSVPAGRQVLLLLKR